MAAIPPLPAGNDADLWTIGHSVLHLAPAGPAGINQILNILQGGVGGGGGLVGAVGALDIAINGVAGGGGGLVGAVGALDIAINGVAGGGGGLVGAVGALDIAINGVARGGGGLVGDVRELGIELGMMRHRERLSAVNEQIREMNGHLGANARLTLPIMTALPPNPTLAQIRASNAAPLPLVHSASWPPVPKDSNIRNLAVQELNQLAADYGLPWIANTTRVKKRRIICSFIGIDP